MYNKGTTTESRPSDSRRAQLREIHSLQTALEDRQHIILSNFCPIQRYYDTADKVLDAFLSSYEQNNLDDAYVLGKRFTSFSTDTLPTHSYYKSKQELLRKLRNDNIRKVGLVADALEDITKLMDKEEVMKAKEEIRRREDCAKEKILVRRRKMMEQHRLEKRKDEDVFSLEEKLNQWNLEYPKQESLTNDDLISNKTSLTLKDKTSLDYESIDHNYIKPSNALIQSISNSDNSLLPPSYDDAIANLMPPIQPPPPIDDPVKVSVIPEDITKLQCTTKVMYESLKSTKQIQFFPLSTHQGKNSTNGCTVIAPLLAIRYLSSSSPTLPDVLIEQVIDMHAPPVLSKVRAKLGLEGDALIIPSDVHDYFLEEKLLHQDQFMGVVGGNILHKPHLHSLFTLMQQKKQAATLYFHEHVITILKLEIKKEVWYDIIDSMPRPNAAMKIRCKDLTALEMVLKQYAFEKFTKKDWRFIESHVWQESLCHIDPRVFQAFVWSQKDV